MRNHKSVAIYNETWEDVKALARYLTYIGAQSRFERAPQNSCSLAEAIDIAVTREISRIEDTGEEIRDKQPKKGV